MKYSIREYTDNDYYDVCVLLDRYNLERMSMDEMSSSLGLVAEVNDELVGFMWALIGDKVGIIDYLVVDEDYRDKAECGRSVIGLALASKMFSEMIKCDITKFVGIMDKNDYNDTMLRFYRDTLGMTERRPFVVVKGDPQEVWEKLEVLNGRHVCHTRN